MQVFKFGGASIKSPGAVKNMSEIIGKYQHHRLLVIVSAMGKTTNALEKIIEGYVHQKDFHHDLEQLKDFHYTMVEDLFSRGEEVRTEVDRLFDLLALNLMATCSYDKLYDQVVSIGELLSSTIIAAYLNKIGVQTTWLDARDFIKTDDHYRQANVDWAKTERLMTASIPSILANGTILTQGYIGSTGDDATTTLGREGSDFSAAVFASLLDAKSVTVWKDVPGILNADPKMIDDAKLFPELPYKEAAEMTYYGASVIHPKTIKPLANKNIPLYVKSFYEHDEPGTIIHHCEINERMPVIIIKNNQCLLSFKVMDYSFVNEDNLSVIFKELAKADLRISIMQNSAISFSVALDDDLGKVDSVVGNLRDEFNIFYNTGLQLITIKNHSPSLIDEYRRGRKILLEQISRSNYRALIAPTE